jgi:TPR repeat protein
MFVNGNGVKQDYDEAMKFYQLAILSGCEKAKSKFIKVGKQIYISSTIFIGRVVF